MTFLEFKIARINELLCEPRCRDAYPNDQTNRVAGLIELISQTQAQSVLEIGSHRGISTEVFLLLCRSVVAVDPLEETTMLSAAEFKMRCAGYPNLQIIKGYSPEALAGMPSECFDLVYIDAMHDFESVKKDIAASHRLVKIGGYLSGHDHSQYTDVPKAVTEFVEQFGGDLLLFPDASWAIQKKETVRKAA